MKGKAKHISGLSVRGNTLTIRLTHADPLILTQLALPYFCAVPTDTPIDAQGVTTVPAAGPYYVASYNPGQGAVLKRNPNYHGSRPHTLDEIDYTDNVGAAQSVPDIEAGKADYAAAGDPSRPVRDPRRPLRPRQPRRPRRRPALLHQPGTLSWSTSP